MSDDNIVDFGAARKRREERPERPRLLLDALDTLALALANHGHAWTDDERLLYESATEDLIQFAKFAEMRRRVW